jgi:hypothetical protein
LHKFKELDVYIVNPAGTQIIASATVLVASNTNGQWYHESYTFIGLTSGQTVKIAFGRNNAWATNYQLEAAGANILVTPG